MSIFVHRQSRTDSHLECWVASWRRTLHVEVGKILGWIQLGRKEAAVGSRAVVTVRRRVVGSKH